jgi:hypothetical protein
MSPPRCSGWVGGTAIQFATLSAGLNGLSTSDFLIVV